MGRPKGIPATEKQKASAPKARKAAAAARAARAEARALVPDEKPRWQQLEDGDITVKDLSERELKRGQIANNDGTFEGRRHALKPKWLTRMEAEQVRRMRVKVRNLGVKAVDVLGEIMEDDEARAQQFQAARLMLEYNIGKVPEVIHVGQETEWDRMAQGAYVIQRGIDAVQVDDDPEDEPRIVRGEVVEEEQA